MDFFDYCTTTLAVVESLKAENHGIEMVSKEAHHEIGNHVSVTFEVSVEVWVKTGVGVNPKTIGKATHES